MSVLLSECRTVGPSVGAVRETPGRGWGEQGGTRKVDRRLYDTPVTEEDLTLDGPSPRSTECAPTTGLVTPSLTTSPTERESDSWTPPHLRYCKYCKYLTGRAADCVSFRNQLSSTTIRSKQCTIKTFLLYLKWCVSTFLPGRGISQSGPPSLVRTYMDRQPLSTL